MSYHHILEPQEVKRWKPMPRIMASLKALYSADQYPYVWGEQPNGASQCGHLGQQTSMDFRVWGRERQWIDDVTDDPKGHTQYGRKCLGLLAGS
ncbi:hypothetical protein ACIFQM_01785 [Paenibacillus sp. NRS-1782]|uniref:hypothetical protein n=1 Tax=unclassified Paenibacillus TaxID=185978 RepID=UPI003D286EC7